ncbi:transmembrane protein 256-like isoform X2 [Planococcus citri]
MGYKSGPTATEVPILTRKELWNILSINRNYIRLAGLFGASAVIIGAYGAHTLMTQEGKEHEKKVFETASKYHFYHTCALFAVPFCRFPKVTALAFIGGMILFCGSCYHQTLMEDQTFRKVTPYGGSLLILGWITMML